MNLDEALDMVEAAGYTVTDQREIVAYYQSRERHYRELLLRAEKGDWLAAERLIQHAMRGLDRMHSHALQDFVLFLLKRTLSKQPITSARTAAKRLKYPTLAVLLRTGSRKDYALLYRKRRFSRRFHSCFEEGVQHTFKRQGGQSVRDALIEYLAIAENIPIEKANTWINEIKVNT